MGRNYFFLEPGLIAGIPLAQSAHDFGSQLSTSSVKRDLIGTPAPLNFSFLPAPSFVEGAPLLFTMEPTPTGLAPHCLTRFITSPVESPVVMTSSTTSVRSFGASEEFRR